jgi:YD repeat-containing protein
LPKFCCFTNITYPVSPAISLAYDALNRLTNMVDAAGTTKYGYDNAGQILSEDGPWSDDTVTYAYNNRLRTSLSLLAPNADPWTQTYGYDGARRLTSTVSPAGSFSYTRQVSVLTIDTFSPTSRIRSAPPSRWRTTP